MSAPKKPARAVRIRCDGGWSLCPQERTHFGRCEYFAVWPFASFAAMQPNVRSRG